MSPAQENGLVADEVRAWLARRRISAAQAASRIGWSQTYLSRRMRGDVPFSVPDLIELARLLKIRVVQFFPEVAEAATRKGYFLNWLLTC